MSEPRFTPGPWKADHPTMGFSALRAGKKMVFALACPSRMHGDEELSDEEKYANLSLVKHAPDLYNALQSILEIGKRDMTNGKYDGYFDGARAATAKARGEA